MKSIKRFERKVSSLGIRISEEKGVKNKTQMKNILFYFNLLNISQFKETVVIHFITCLYCTVLEGFIIVVCPLLRFGIFLMIL